MSDHQEQNVRLPYEKPALRTIEFASEEVLGFNCKQTSGAPGRDTSNGCGVSPCTAAGGS